MSLKPGVRIIGIRPELVMAWIEAREVWARFGVADVVMTSCVDGVHTRSSKHYVGCAIDLRSKGMSPATIAAAVRDLQMALGSDFDVVSEAVGTANEHVHVEFEPKDPL